MIKRPSKEDYYLDIALAVSKRSTCLRRHYGCVIVKDDVIVSTGYNGSPRGCDNCCDIGKCQREDSERYQGYEKCPAVHAEQNALLSVDRAHSQGATLYLVCEEVNTEEILCLDGSGSTDKIITKLIEDENPMPCNICSKMITNAGILKVVTRKGVIWV